MAEAVPGMVLPYRTRRTSATIEATMESSYLACWLRGLRPGERRI